VFRSSQERLSSFSSLGGGCCRKDGVCRSRPISAPADVDLKNYAGLHLVALLDGDGATPLQRAQIAEGDLVLVRSDAETAGRFALDMHLAVREGETAGPIADVLLSRASGLAEVVIPLRSKMIGQPVLPEMTTEEGDLMVLAIQRGGIEMREEAAVLRAGDHLLLQGTWKALDQYLSDPKVLVVDSPEVVQKQAVALGQGAPAAIAILLLLFILLAFNIVPAPIGAVIGATLMVISRVMTLPQLYRGIDWNTCILIGAMIPPATAMTKTGAAALIGDYVVSALGSAGPHVVLAGIFLVSAVITQFISNTSSALVMMPIGVATASELGVSALPMMMGVAMGASASFPTPFANGGKPDGVWARRIPLRRFLEARPHCHGLGADRHSGRGSSFLEILKRSEATPAKRLAKAASRGLRVTSQTTRLTPFTSSIISSPR
jgi:Citrate transporter